MSLRNLGEISCERRVEWRTGRSEAFRNKGMVGDVADGEKMVKVIEGWLHWLSSLSPSQKLAYVGFLQSAALLHHAEIYRLCCNLRNQTSLPDYITALAPVFRLPTRSLQCSTG